MMMLMVLIIISIMMIVTDMIGNERDEESESDLIIRFNEIGAM